MLELPEAVTLTRQMNKTLTGKTIVSAKANVSPHRFAFYQGDPETYAEKLRNQIIGEATARGSLIATAIGTGRVLALGDGGLRILYHEQGKKLPKKHQLLLGFDDSTCLTVSVSGWGAVWLMTHGEQAAHKYAGYEGVSPTSAEFTEAYLDRLFAAVPPGDKRSIKYFIVSDPKIWGVANGYLQDILFRAQLHPRRRVVGLTDGERHRLYSAVRTTIREAIAANGRITERDLFNQRGNYTPLMYTKTKSTPCTVCGTTIEKISYLGGSCYLCPICQPLPEE
jgi:formamidopyrimidine-DNA glycosylase